MLVFKWFVSLFSVAVGTALVVCLPENTLWFLLLFTKVCFFSTFCCVKSVDLPLIVQFHTHQLQVCSVEINICIQRIGLDECKT